MYVWRCDGQLIMSGLIARSQHQRQPLPYCRRSKMRRQELFASCCYITLRVRVIIIITINRFVQRRKVVTSEALML